MSQMHMDEEQLAWVEESTHRAVRKALKRQAATAGVGFLVLFGGMFFAGRAYLNVLHQGLVGSCQRVNVLRAQSNLSDTVSFNILSISAQRETALVKLDPDPKAAKEHKESAMKLANEAGKLTVTKVTNCDQAVGHPDQYVTPVAGPIGDPITGKLNPGVRTVVRESHELLHQEQVTSDAG